MMKTGQMLFVAFGGMMLGAAGTLAIQTGLMHYEVSLDIRPRGPLTLPPPALASSVTDPYTGATMTQTWQAEPRSAGLPVALPPLDDQQIADISAIREQVGHPVSKQLADLACPEGQQCETFADHLRAAAAPTRCPHDPVPESDADSSVARDLKDEATR
jgi:hypothetical protein